jgi:tRNA dimethylallyltransferase
MHEILGIIGPTASGKNALSHLIALRHRAELISVDSMKVYRGMDVGTAKPSAARRAEVRYHMIDILDPSEDMDLKWYVDRVDGVLNAQPGTRWVMSGGSAMYIKGILSGVFAGVPRDDAIRAELAEAIAARGPAALHRELAAVDPAAAGRILPGDAKRIIRALEVHRLTGRPISGMQVQFAALRPGYRFTLVGLRYERTRLHGRINDRVERMLADGLVAEVRRLHAAGRFGRTAGQAIGYREVIAALDAGADPGAAAVTEAIKRNTRVFARKQMTWFRKFPGVHWIDIAPADTVLSVYERIEPILKETWA